jgi:hypothetical protein
MRWIKGSDGSDRDGVVESIVTSVGDERLVDESTADSEATSTIDKGFMSGED